MYACTGVDILLKDLLGLKCQAVCDEHHPVVFESIHSAYVALHPVIE